MNMGFIKAATDTFFDICSTVALTVNTITDWTAFILHGNYVLVTNIYYSVCSVLSVMYTVIHYFAQVVCSICAYIFDFLAELYACFCALMVLLWRVCVLVYKVLCLLFTGVETVVLGLWNGGILTYKTLQQSAKDVADTCESTVDYVAMLVQDFVMYVCGVLTSVGNFSSSAVRFLWIGLGYVPAMLSLLPSYIAGWLSKTWARCTMWVSFTFMEVNRQTYLGIIVCCILYVFVSKLVFLMHRRGLTLFPFRRRRRRIAEQTHNNAVFPFDGGFESDVDDADQMENDNFADSDYGDNSEGEDTDAHTELTLSDNDSEDNSAESDVSLDSQTFSSEDSDHGIDVQLPDHDSYQLRSRSSTPSRNLSKDMDADDFEREIERERDKRKCVVCQDANKSVLLLPCKHMCLCVGCANQIVRSFFADRRICPLCRTRIERVMDVFV